MGSNRRMDHMTWPEFKEAKTRPVIVPIGSTEQHGQHLPIGTDAVLATRVATIVETNWWDPVPQSVIDKVFDGLVFPGWALEHAAVTETSLMLHYAPELVHMDRMVEEAGATAKSYVRYPVRQGDVPAHGGLANPAGSSAERGRLIAEACVDAVAEICAEEFGE